MGDDDRPTYDRRKAIKSLGVIGTGLVGVQSMSRDAQAIPIWPPKHEDEIQMAAKKVGNRVSGQELCVLLGVGCGIATAFAAADTIPYDAVLIGKACASATGGCEIWAVFKDKHGKQPADVWRAKESKGKINKDDYIVVPSKWNWSA